MRLQALAMLGQVAAMAYGDAPAQPGLAPDVEAFNQRYRIALMTMGAEIPAPPPIEVTPGDDVMASELEAFNQRYKIAINLSDLYIEAPTVPDSFGLSMLLTEVNSNNQRYMRALESLNT